MSYQSRPEQMREMARNLRENADVLEELANSLLDKMRGSVVTELSVPAVPSITTISDSDGNTDIPEFTRVPDPVLIEGEPCPTCGKQVGQAKEHRTRAGVEGEAVNLAPCLRCGKRVPVE